MDMNIHFLVTNQTGFKVPTPNSGSPHQHLTRSKLKDNFTCGQTPLLTPVVGQLTLSYQLPELRPGATTTFDEQRGIIFSLISPLYSPAVIRAPPTEGITQNLTQILKTLFMPFSLSLPHLLQADKG